MFARISYTWELMGASWNVLKRDKALVLFPLFSCIACVVVLASFAVPFFIVSLPAWKSLGHLTQQQQIQGWVMLFAFYFANYFVITFFNVGIVASAITRMSGGEPSFAGGMRAAMARAHLIAGWALVSATVGLLLKVVESHNKLGRIVAGLLGAAWTLMTFLVVPVLVVENKGPIAALKESMQLLKKTWGTQLIGNFSFGAIFALLCIPGMAAVFGSIYLMINVSGRLGAAVLCLAILYIIALSLVQSTLHSIFQAAVYMYTQGISDATHAFPVQLLRDAVRTK